MRKSSFQDDHVMAHKYVMIYEKDGQMIERPFESSVPFPSSKHSKIYVRADDTANRVRLREEVRDRIQIPDAHIRAFLQHLHDMRFYMVERRERAADKTSEVEVIHKIEEAPKKPPITPPIMTPAARFARK